MPIFAKVAAPPPPPPVLVPEIGRIVATYIDPTGTAWPLTTTAAGWYTLADGVSGLGAAPITLTTDPSPRGGARLRHVQPQPRTIVWPLHVYGATHLEFVARWRALARAITRTSRDGPGILEIARPDGTRRQIQVRYQGGFEGQGTRQASGNRFDSAVLSWLCEDPYWYDPTAVTVLRVFGGDGATEDYLAPYPMVSSSQVLGEGVLTNPGDVLAWPTWTISGPATSATIANVDTGEAFTIDPNAGGIAHGNLTVGEFVSVSTDPPQVRFSDGSNWSGALDWPAAALWGVPPGETHVDFALAGAEAGSSLTGTFHARYETA